MQPHIELTIQSIDQKIAGLQTLREALRELDSPSIKLLQPTVAKAEAAASRAARNHGSSKAAIPNGLQDELLAVLPKLPAQFDLNSVAGMLSGRSRISVQGALSYLVKKGTLKTIVPGRPGYPAKLSLATAKQSKAVRVDAPAVAVSSPPVATRQAIEKKLQDACKQRDVARANGRDTMEELFQKEIDRLEEQLAAGA